MHKTDKTGSTEPATSAETKSVAKSPNSGWKKGDPLPLNTLEGDKSPIKLGNYKIVTSTVRGSVRKVDILSSARGEKVRRSVLGEKNEEAKKTLVSTAASSSIKLEELGEKLMVRRR